VLNDIDVVLNRYETRQMSRRELLAALLAITLPSAPSRQTSPLIGPVTQLNHATLFVKDVARSQEFIRSSSACRSLLDRDSA
jgi:hypothetical protein